MARPDSRTPATSTAISIRILDIGIPSLLRQVVPCRRYTAFVAELVGDLPPESAAFICPLPTFDPPRIRIFIPSRRAKSVRAGGHSTVMPDISRRQVRGLRPP